MKTKWILVQLDKILHRKKRKKGKEKLLLSYKAVQLYSHCTVQAAIKKQQPNKILFWFLHLLDETN